MKELPKIKIGKKPIYLKIAEDIDFHGLFVKIEEEFDTCFIYESLGEEGKFSRYSIIGFNPEYIISARGNNMTIDGENYPVANPYLALKTIMPSQTLTRDYAGGLIGYLSYDAINYMEPSVSVKVHELFDQFMFGVYTDGLIHDKLTNELFYFYYNADRSSVLKNLMKTNSSKKSFKAKLIKDGLSEKEHAQIVENVKEQIRAGNTFQCEVGFKTEYEIKGDVISIYEKLRNVNPSPFMYYLKFGVPHTVPMGKLLAKLENISSPDLIMPVISLDICCT